MENSFNGDYMWNPSLNRYVNPNNTTYYIEYFEGDWVYTLQKRFDKSKPKPRGPLSINVPYIQFEDYLVSVPTKFYTNIQISKCIELL